MKFELKHRDSLTIEDYLNHGTWVQYYSADEIDHIANEGYDKKEVEQKLLSVNWSDEYWFKSFHFSNTTPYMFTRFYTEFEFPNKKIIKGYIEFTEYSGVQNYSLFVDQEFISLNVQHPDVTDERELELKTKLQLNQLYPIRVACSDKQLNTLKYEPIQEDNKE